MTVRMLFLTMPVIVALIAGTIGCGDADDSHEEG